MRWCGCLKRTRSKIFLLVFARFHRLLSWLPQTEDKPEGCLGPADYLSESIRFRFPELTNYSRSSCIVAGESKKPCCTVSSKYSPSLTLWRRCFQGFDVRKFPFLFVATRPCLACLQGDSRCPRNGGFLTRMYKQERSDCCEGSDCCGG